MRTFMGTDDDILAGMDKFDFNVKVDSIVKEAVIAAASALHSILHPHILRREAIYSVCRHNRRYVIERISYMPYTDQEKSAAVDRFREVAFDYYQQIRPDEIN